MNFYIKQYSTLPALKYPLTQKIMEKYSITKDMLENVGVTFSMIDIETGLFVIANVAADLLINEDKYTVPTEEEFTLSYMFKLNDTRTTGRFIGQFKLDFLGPIGCGKITLPNDEDINILISSAITKTSVI